MANRLNRSKTVQAARRAAKARSADATPPRGRAGRARPTTEPRWTATEEPTDRAPGARRIRRVIVGMGVATAVLAAQAVHLQLVQHQRLAAEADAQAVTTAMVRAKRGTIRDRNGHELAITVDVDSVVYSPVKGQRRPSADEGRVLAGLLRRSEAEVIKRLSQTRVFSYLARRVDTATADEVRALNAPGVTTQKEAKRFYANIQLASHVLGFTNVEGQGRAGIERRFDDELKGRQQAVTGLRDAFGSPILSKGTVPQLALRGVDVELTLDRHIQFAAEEALAAAVADHRAKSGWRSSWIRRRATSSRWRATLGSIRTTFGTRRSLSGRIGRSTRSSSRARP